MVLVAYVRPAAALRVSVLRLPTDIHSLFANKPSSSFDATRFNDTRAGIRIKDTIVHGGSLSFFVKRQAKTCCTVMRYTTGSELPRLYY